MAIGTKYLQIFYPVVMYVTIQVMQLQWDRLPLPFCQTTTLTSSFFQSAYEETVLEFV